MGKRANNMNRQVIKNKEKKKWLISTQRLTFISKHYNIKQEINIFLYQIRSKNVMSSISEDTYLKIKNFHTIVVSFGLNFLQNNLLRYKYRSKP